MENKKAVAVENAAEDTIDLLEIFISSNTLLDVFKKIINSILNK